MDNLSVYRDLADSYDRLGQASMRDRFLILAADAALESGQTDEAEHLRQRLLQGSRHHMLRPYNSFTEAVRAADVQTYLRDLRANYPLDVAHQLLDSLQSDPGNVRETQPIHWGALPTAEPAPAIPPTAPMIDMANSRPSPPADIAADISRPEERTPAPARRFSRFDIPPIGQEQPHSPARPLAQPLPGRPTTSARPGGVPVAAPASAWSTASQPPVAKRQERPASSSAEPDREPPLQGGAWLNMVLVGVVLTAGLALAGYTLARPFLPANWLP